MHPLLLGRQQSNRDFLPPDGQLQVLVPMKFLLDNYGGVY